ncbi:PA14 domain-containing protein [Sulfitobacter alexandrii]|nr:PA14 domain-containing protein [Sulfitobacter alexandrii]
MLKCTTLLVGLALAAPSFAQTLTLAPASPQPSGLKQGLAVDYAYYGVRSLKEAKGKLDRAKAGPPLQGLSYLDSDPGDKTMTSTSAEKVLAAISGYIKFDAPGTYDLEFISNDGLEASIGGQQVALFDGVHGCESAGVTTVQVPQAGWYEIEATYFQRKGTACLLMDWGQAGNMEPVPDSAFGYK